MGAGAGSCRSSGCREGGGAKETFAGMERLRARGWCRPGRAAKGMEAGVAASGAGETATGGAELGSIETTAPVEGSTAAAGGAEGLGAGSCAQPHGRTAAAIKRKLDFVIPKLNYKMPMNKSGLRFVLLLGVVSLFADFAYEGARSITGPFMASLGASGMAVALASGLGELCGYGLRVLSGSLSERTRAFWPITIAGYFIQMAAVPCLALSGSWRSALLLIVAERAGKGLRSPPRDAMLAHAGKDMGLGWGFGLHEALDQIGALAGPLIVAAVIASRGGYRTAFSALAAPAALACLLVLAARFSYPEAGAIDASGAVDENGMEGGFSRSFWIYLSGAALVAAGFADFPLMAYHFQKSSLMKADRIPVAYAIAMASSGTGSLVFGRLFDRAGLRILAPLTLFSAAFAPLAFLGGGLWPAMIGSALWGLGVGVHESIIPAAVASMVPARRRPSAYGVFTAVYGFAWFLGSIPMGLLYDRSASGLVAFSVGLELAAVPVFLFLAKRTPSCRNR